MNEAEIACGGFVVAGCEASGAFELVEAAFDAVAERVDETVDGNGFLAIGAAWNDRHCAALFEAVADLI